MPPRQAPDVDPFRTPASEEQQRLTREGIAELYRDLGQQSLQPDRARMWAPDDPLQAGPTVTLDEIRDRRFSLIDRRNAQQIMEAEDAEIFRALDRIAAEGFDPRPQLAPEPPVGRDEAYQGPRRLLWERLLVDDLNA